MHHQGVVVGPAAYGGVFVFAETPEVERDSVDQEFRAPYLHGAHAHGLPVTVDEVAGGAPQRDFECVEVAVAGRPGVHVFDPEGSLRAGGGMDLDPGGVTQRDTHLVLFGLCGAVHAVGDEAGRVLQAGGHGDVGDVDGGRGVQPHGPVQARVVEEVLEAVLHPAAVRSFLHPAGRYRLPGQFVVDHDGDTVLGTRPQVRRDVGLEGGVTAFVPGDLDIVDPGDGAMRRGIEAEYRPFPRPPVRNPYLRLVPDVPDMVADGLVREDVVVTGRHRDVHGTRELRAPPALGTAGTLRVQAEAPQAAERAAFTSGAVLGTKHGWFSCSVCVCRRGGREGGDEGHPGRVAARST